MRPYRQDWFREGMTPLARKVMENELGRFLGKLNLPTCKQCGQRVPKARVYQILQQHGGRK